MLESLFNTLVVVGLALQLLVLHELIQGAYKKYPLLLVYSLALLATTVAEATRFFIGGVNDTGLKKWYWINDNILRVLLFFIVIFFVYRALEGYAHRATVVRGLALGALLILGVSLFIAWDPIGLRFRQSGLRRTSANLDFAAALLAMALWTALLRQPRKDWQLLQLTAGVGLEVSVEAIAHSIRSIVHADSVFATGSNLLAVVTHLLGLYIWWRALRMPPAKVGA